MIERSFNIPFIASLSLREKQIQQNYRPVIAVHKWFARRPGTLFRGLLLSELAREPLDEAFYQSQNFPGLRIADPFMGGGTPLLEANRIGCDVIGYDINPMSHWIVRQELEHLDLGAYREAAHSLRSALQQQVGDLYQTACNICGKDAPVKYFLWVKQHRCDACNEDFDLIPGYLVSKDVRHPKNVLVCSGCGNLNEVDNASQAGECSNCATPLKVQGPARRNQCRCPQCGASNRYPQSESGPPRHRLFAIEYHCPDCRPSHKGRFFKKPDDKDLQRAAMSEQRLNESKPRFIPDDVILPGDESDRLHRWGYGYYRELFNARQLLGLELSARLIAEQSDKRVRTALATNLSDLLRYQNMLCRYDTMALKSLDIFSVHGFPVGLIQCESNILGILEPRKKSVVGSGGWLNITSKFAKAKAFCDEPFEILHRGKRKVRIPMEGEWIGDHRNANGCNGTRRIDLKCADAGTAVLPPQSLDGVFTDPPYFGNVQYAELMDFCYVWLRKLVEKDEPAFRQQSTRNADELTVNRRMGRDLAHFSDGLSGIFRTMAQALKIGAPFVFTYHHNEIMAYHPVALAILDAGLVCSATLPCPAEMGASIHINGTGSSIVDTVFVCRSTGSVPRRWIVDTPAQIAGLVEEDLAQLRAGGVKPTRGDTRCLIFGHIIRLAIWELKDIWDSEVPIDRKLLTLQRKLMDIGKPESIECHLNTSSPQGRQFELQISEQTAKYFTQGNVITF